MVPVFQQDQLFLELTNEEESNITGGGAIPFAVVAAVKIIAATGALAAAGAAFMNLMNRFGGWIGSRGNGVIIGDRKGSTRDWRRAGDVPTDLPHGWNWGVRSNGNWIAGGYNGPKP